MSSHWTLENVERLTREYLGQDDGSAQSKKRARILAAATRSFMERGYRKTSIDEVASAARVAKGTVYLYFPSKADLLSHAIALEKKALMGRFEPLFTGAIPPRERLRVYLETVFAAVHDLPLVSRLMGGDAELLEALDDPGPEVMERQTAEGRPWTAGPHEPAAPPRGDTVARGTVDDAAERASCPSAPLLRSIPNPWGDPPTSTRRDGSRGTPPSRIPIAPPARRKPRGKDRSGTTGEQARCDGSS